MAKLEQLIGTKLNNVPQTEIDAQEHLGVGRLRALKEKTTIGANVTQQRPEESLVKLMGWAEEMFAPLLKPKGRVNRFFHNKIIIDGEFLQFCDENRLTVEPLLRDSITSWKTEGGTESFFMQGVFLISTGTTRFLHCALFHKGNQNEDEISLFVLVDDDSYEGYIAIRNQFEEWSLKRDRNHLMIYVADGDPIPYDRNQRWEDLFLPEELKRNLRQSVEGFLNSRHVYRERDIPWKRGIIMYGSPGCGKTSAIRTIISCYDFKPVTVAPGGGDDALAEAFAYAESQSPSLIYFEDLDSMLEEVSIAHFLQLMDGIQSKNGTLVIATANNLSALKANVKDRPSRFDRKFEIPLPNAEMSARYLTKWFGRTITDKKTKLLADCAVRYGFSYAYLKELYISAVYCAIAEDRDRPTEKDVDTALQQLMDDRFKKGRTPIGIDRYLGGK